MGEHQFKIDFVVNAEQAKQAKAEEVQGYKAVESAAVQAAKVATEASESEARARKAKVAEILTTEQIAAKAREAVIRETNQKAIKGEVDRLQASKAAAMAQVDGARQAAQAMNQLGVSGQGVARGLVSIAGAVGGITSLAGLATAVVGEFDKIQESIRESVKHVGDFRAELRELAGIKGAPSPNAATVAAEMAFRGKTLQSAGDATKMQTSALGLAAASVGPQGKIDEKGFQTYLEAAGKLQVSKNVDAEAMGNLAGSMVLNQPGKVTSEDMKRQLVGMFKVADLGALEAAPFADQFSKAAPLVGSGDFGSLQELGAVMSAMSFGGKDTVGERMRQLVRMTRGSVVDVSKPAGADTSPAEYYAKLGVKDTMGTRDILEKMSEDVKAKQKAQRGNFSMETYLRKSGFGSTEDIGAFKQYFNYRDSLNSTFLPMANTLPTAEEADKQLNEFRSTPLGFQAQANFAEDAAKVTQGIGSPEYVEAYKRDLFARLTTRDQGKLFGWGGKYESSQSAWNMPSFEKEMLEDLRKKGEAVGLDWMPKMVSTGMADFMEDPLAGRASTNADAGQLFSQITQRGGNVMGSPEMMDLLERQAKAAEATEKSMKIMADNSRPPRVLAVGPKPQTLGRAP